MSKEKERIKRPEPERTEPLRSWSTLFGVRGGSAASSDSGTGAPGGERSGAALNDVVARSVDLGYRVVDEYIRQGQKAAQRFGDRSWAPDAAVGDLREAADRMAQYTSDFLALWFQVLQLAGSAGAGWGGVPPADGVGGSASAAEPGPSAAAGDAKKSESRPIDRKRVKIEVASLHPTEVSLDLRSDAGKGPLVVHGLRAADSAKPRLTDVTLEPESESEPVRLRIRVPADQPAGTYSGLIVDERSNRPAGTLSVRITRE